MDAEQLERERIQKRKERKTDQALLTLAESLEDWRQENDMSRSEALRFLDILHGNRWSEGIWMQRGDERPNRLKKIPVLESSNGAGSDQ